MDPIVFQLGVLGFYMTSNVRKRIIVLYIVSLICQFDMDRYFDVTDFF